MLTNVKAALLSAFVLPGLGQLYKGEKVKGGILLVLVNIFLLAALFIVMKGMGTFLVTARISGTSDALQVLEKVRQDSPVTGWLLAGFVMVWMAAVVDAALTRPRKDDTSAG